MELFYFKLKNKMLISMDRFYFFRAVYFVKSYSAAESPVAKSVVSGWKEAKKLIRWYFWHCTSVKEYENLSTNSWGITTICTRTLTPVNAFKCGFCIVIAGYAFAKQSKQFRDWRCWSTSKAKMRSPPPLLRTKCPRGLFRNSPPCSDALLMDTCL